MPMINPQALRMIPPEAMLRGPPPPDFFQGKPPMMMPFEGNLDNGVEPLDPEKEEKQKAIRLLQAGKRFAAEPPKKRELGTARHYFAENALLPDDIFYLFFQFRPNLFEFSRAFLNSDICKF